MGQTRHLPGNVLFEALATARDITWSTPVNCRGVVSSRHRHQCFLSCGHRHSPTPLRIQMAPFSTSLPLPLYWVSLSGQLSHPTSPTGRRQTHHGHGVSFSAFHPPTNMPHKLLPLVPTGTYFGRHLRHHGYQSGSGFFLWPLHRK